MYKIGDLLEILWIDAIGENDEWSTFDSFDYNVMSAAAVTASAGYFVKQGKKSIYLSQIYRPADKAIARMLSIPLGCIIKIKKRG